MQPVCPCPRGPVPPPRGRPRRGSVRRVGSSHAADTTTDTSATRIRHAPRDRFRDPAHPYRRADPRPALPAYPVLGRPSRRRGPDRYVHHERARVARRHPAPRVPPALAGAGRGLALHPPGIPPARPRDRRLPPVDRETPRRTDADHRPGGTGPPVPLLVPPPLRRALALRPDEHGG